MFEISVMTFGPGSAGVNDREGGNGVIPVAPPVMPSRVTVNVAAVRPVAVNVTIPDVVPGGTLSATSVNV